MVGVASPPTTTPPPRLECGAASAPTCRLSWRAPQPVRSLRRFCRALGVHGIHLAHGLSARLAPRSASVPSSRQPELTDVAQTATDVDRRPQPWPRSPSPDRAGAPNANFDKAPRFCALIALDHGWRARALRCRTRRRVATSLSASGPPAALADAGPAGDLRAAARARGGITTPYALLRRVRNSARGATRGPKTRIGARRSAPHHEDAQDARRGAGTGALRERAAMRLVHARQPVIMFGRIDGARHRRWILSTRVVAEAKRRASSGPARSEQRLVRL